MNWSLIAGPGPRIAELKAYLVPETNGGARVRLVDIGDLGGLLDHDGGTGKLLLASDELSIEDVGLLRHWLRRESAFELVLCGSDPSRRAVRRLLQTGRGRWLQWPPDIEELRALMRAPHAPDEGALEDEPAPRRREPEELSSVELTPAPRRAAGTASGARGASTELERIEEILEAPDSETRGGEARRGERATFESERAVPPRPSERRASEARTGRGQVDEYERAASRAARSFPFTPPGGAGETTEDEPIELTDTGPSDPGPPSRRVLAPHPRRPEDIFARALETQPASIAARETERSEQASASAPARESAPMESARAPTESARRAAEPAQAPTAPSARRETALPAPYFRDQVADLADMAQRIELDLAGVRDSVYDAGITDASLEPALEHLSQDVARLLQFTRTLGYLVAPPPAGNQGFDLAELVELFVTTAGGGGADGPRFLLRKDGAARVTSDRQLLSQALDALFFVARSAARPGEVVRVHLRLDAEPPTAAEIGIEFPVGPLAGLDPARIVEPYALRRTLPELGANALLAASGIVRGQGGDIELARVGEGHLEWRVRLPISEPQSGVAPAGGARTPSRADDPFA
jgi:hypothetical protein